MRFIPAFPSDRGSELFRHKSITAITITALFIPAKRVFRHFCAGAGSAVIPAFRSETQKSRPYLGRILSAKSGRFVAS